MWTVIFNIVLSVEQKQIQILNQDLTWRYEDWESTGTGLLRWPDLSH